MVKETMVAVMVVAEYIMRKVTIMVEIMIKMLVMKVVVVEVKGR